MEENMNKYEKAIKLMEEFCGNGKDNLIAMATIALSETSDENPQPAVRMVDAYYEDRKFYISSASWKNKTLEIERNNKVSICGLDLFTAQGTAENLGWVKDEKNKEIRSKMKKYFDWFDDHGNEDSPESIVIRISLTEGVITDHEQKYGEWQYKVDFVNKTAQ